MLGINREAAIFLSACLTGNVLYLSYQILGVFRKLIKHRLFWISTEDMLYWIIAGLFLFSEIYHTCYGSIRWYFVLGVIVGGAVTNFLCRKIKKRIAQSRKKR